MTNLIDRPASAVARPRMEAEVERLIRAAPAAR